MKVDAFLTQFFTEKENQFKDSIVVMIDVLRASATVCAALSSGAKEVIAIDSVDKAVQIFSSLSKESRFIGGERNGLKPSGFDAGNSPADYTVEAVKGKTVILTTTNGAQLYQKCKLAKFKIVASFVNIEAVVNFIQSNSSEDTEINIMCAGNDGRLSYEDTLCAGAIINRIISIYPEITITDSAFATQSLYKLHESNLKEFIKTREHSLYLNEIGFEADIDLCLEFNKYPVIPMINGTSIKKVDL
jgi:2-phosphosulfolactate phosphatase